MAIARLAGYGNSFAVVVQASALSFHSVMESAAAPADISSAPPMISDQSTAFVNDHDSSKRKFIRPPSDAPVIQRCLMAVDLGVRTHRCCGLRSVEVLPESLYFSCGFLGLL